MYRKRLPFRRRGTASPPQQTELLVEAGADFLYAALMPALHESPGTAQTMTETGLPLFLNFTICADGRLVDGTSLHDAIDSDVSSRPLCAITTCVHPDVVEKARSCPMNGTETMRNRFPGLQAGTANQSFQELVRSTVTRHSSPKKFVEYMLSLRKRFSLRLFDDCCVPRAGTWRP